MASRASGNTPVPDTAASSGASTRTEPTNRTNQSRSRRGRGNKNNGGSIQSQGSNDKKFQGQEESLKECTFDYSEDPQSRRYIKNIELLVGYIGSTTQNIVISVQLNKYRPQGNLIKGGDQALD